MSKSLNKALDSALKVSTKVTAVSIVRTLAVSSGPDPILTAPGVRMYLDMLSFCRPAGSDAEEEFVDRYLRSREDTFEDGFGNFWATVPNPDETQSNILWSSHTDTVHHEDGYQKIVVGDGKVFADNSSCLGADDTTGVWLMLEMIEAKVPGVYVFHREEEIGGHGSTYVAKQHPEYLTGIDCAIALDRKSYASVITKMGKRTCSDTFAISLALALGAPGDYAAEFEPDDSGLFTDTSHYTDLVGECSNLSVGYFNAHSPDEYQDLRFMVALRDTLCSADFSGLVFERKAGEPDPDWQEYSFGGRRSAPKNLFDFVFDNANTTAHFLESMGITLRDMQDYKGDPDAWMCDEEEDDGEFEEEDEDAWDEIAFDQKGNPIKLKSH